MRALAQLLAIFTLLCAPAVAAEYRGFTPDQLKTLRKTLTNVELYFKSYAPLAASADPMILDTEAYQAVVRGEDFRSKVFNIDMKLVFVGDEECSNRAVAQVRHEELDATTEIAKVRICPPFYAQTPAARVQTLAHELYHVTNGADECYARLISFQMAYHAGRSYDYDGSHWMDYQCLPLTEFLPPAENRTAYPLQKAAEELALVIESDAPFTDEKWTNTGAFIGVKSKDGKANLAAVCGSNGPIIVYGHDALTGSSAYDAAVAYIALDEAEGIELSEDNASVLSRLGVLGKPDATRWIIVSGSVAPVLLEDFGLAHRTITIALVAQEAPETLLGSARFSAAGSTAMVKSFLANCQG